MSGRPRILHRVFDGAEYKQCHKCKDWFPIEYFGNQQKAWDGLRCDCKKCENKNGRMFYVNLSEEAKENRRKRIVKYRLENMEKLKAKRDKYYKKNKTKLLKAKVIWRKNNVEKVRGYKRANNKRRRSTTKGHLSINISKSMGKALKGNKAGRHWETFVPYDLDQLLKRLCRTLPRGYTWQDYLDGKLHIDHKIPVSVFNFEKPEDEDFQRCFALKNLQLLPALENIKKSNKLDRPFQPSFKF